MCDRHMASPYSNSRVTFANTFTLKLSFVQTTKRAWVLAMFVSCVLLAWLDTAGMAARHA